MFSNFFIRRPVLSSVVAIVIVIAGLVSLTVLPVERFPNIVPPQVYVMASYPGAAPDVIANTVAAPLEEQINGVDNMLYMNSVSSGSGNMMLAITFAVGTDPDMDLINVNNRVQQAMPLLPQEVQQLGLRVVKRSPTILMVMEVDSPNHRYDTIYLNNYASINIIDDLKRVPGVGDVIIPGSKDYAMRVWLKPDRMAQLGVAPTDVISAIREQNMQFTLGRIGDAPTADPTLDRNYLLTTKGRLETPEEFANIVLRENQDGSVLKLGDVSRVELGGKLYNFSGMRDGNPAVPIMIMLSPGANAIRTADLVKARLVEISKHFPEGVTYTIPYDTTEYVRVSIHEVVLTLLEALVLVFLVVVVFLQKWRASLIPFLAIPVSIIGTFAGMLVLGFSVNTLTLFGLVLAIGIVVDDAIVVLENVDRHMNQEGMTPHDAAIRAMEEVSSPIVAIVLVLSSVFIPVAFIGGFTGELYKQFAVTIAVSVIISGFVALTLTPSLCALLLKPVDTNAKKSLFFRAFNTGFDKLRDDYVATVERLLRRPILAVGLTLLIVAATAVLFKVVPTGLIPDEDQGSLMVLTRLVDAATMSRTEATTQQLESILLKDAPVRHIITMNGYDILAGQLLSNSAISFVDLKPWDQRKRKEDNAFEFANTVRKQTWGIPQAKILVFNPPTVSGLGTTGGFEAYVQNRGTGSAHDLDRVANMLVAAASKRPEFAQVSTTFSPNVPQFYGELDRNRAKALGVSIADAFTAMQCTFGTYYVNDFNKFGRTYEVLLQADSSYRDHPEGLRYVFVRSSTGQMVPLSALLKLKPITGPEIVERYNIFPSAKITGSTAPGYSSGQGIKALEEVASQVLPADYTLAWTGAAYQEKESKGATQLAFILGILMVFLILSAQYESWSLPFAVVTTVPFALFGAVLAIWLRGTANDIYFQVALLMLIGLSAKNAILIVEFARQLHLRGASVFEAAAGAARIRLRPIVMTSFAFVFGCLPLAVSTGAGAEGRHSIGTGVVGGMLAATLIAVFFIPSFFAFVMEGLDWVLAKRHKLPQQQNHGNDGNTEVKP